MNPVAIQMAIANAGDSVEPAALYSFVEGEAADIETYVPAPPPPGAIRAAAVDFVFVLNVAGSIASLASLLWLAYEKFIASRHSASSNAGLILMIRTDDGELTSFWIGNQHRDRDLFIEEFTAKVEAARRAETDGQATERMVAEVRFSGHWVRRK